MLYSQIKKRLKVLITSTMATILFVTSLLLSASLIVQANQKDSISESAAPVSASAEEHQQVESDFGVSLLDLSPGYDWSARIFGPAPQVTDMRILSVTSELGGRETFSPAVYPSTTSREHGGAYIEVVVREIGYGRNSWANMMNQQFRFVRDVPVVGMGNIVTGL